MTLLIVNDIVVEADALKAGMDWAAHGIDAVRVAYSASDARAVIEQENIDILLSDIEMPEENGISLIRWVRGGGLDIDCILLTCHADFSYARDGISLSCIDYVLLPAKDEDILAAVDKAVLLRKSRHEGERLKDYGKSWLKNQETAIEEENQYLHKSPEQVADQCVAYILHHINDMNLTVEDVAREVALNSMYLNRVFKKVKGVNISQWIINERITLAANLFETTTSTANEVAEKVGYPNYPYFSTVFKKITGETPSQYIQNHRK